MATSTAKGISIMFDEICTLYDFNNILARQADVIDFEAPLMQNSSNTVWREVEQMAPVKEGWDMTNEFGDVIQRSYPSTLGLPLNDAFQLRADDFRDDRFMKNRARAAVDKLSGDQNRRIAQLVVDTGTIAYESTVANYTHIAQAETIMDTNELSGMDNRSFFLKPVNHEAIAADLANRGTLSGRPEGAYAKSMVGKDIAGFDAFRLNAIPTYVGAAGTGLTIAGAQSYSPVGNETNADGTVVPVDYRSATVTLSATTGVKRGDKFTVDGVFDVSLGNKIGSDRLATFSVVNVIDGTDIEIFPKPVAWDQRPVADGGDGTLSAEEAAYANVSTSFADTAALVFLGLAATKAIWQPDVFWAGDSVEIVNGSAPFEFMGQMDGFTVIKETLDSGVTVYMMYQGSIQTGTLLCRVFVWYGLVNRKPSHNGIALPNFS
jgi:hypothetical protein